MVGDYLDYVEARVIVQRTMVICVVGVNDNRREREKSECLPRQYIPAGAEEMREEYKEGAVWIKCRPQVTINTWVPFYYFEG